MLQWCAIQRFAAGASMSDPSSLLTTPLYDLHTSLNAKIVDFGGWALPVNYGSQIDEHHAVRNACGMFDVSHMTVSDINGADTIPFLRQLLANDIAKVTNTPGKALYSCMLNEQGGVIDDLITYYMSDTHCRLVTNAATNAKDMAWVATQASGFDITFTEQPELALIAVQGPDALAKCAEILPAEFANIVGELSRFEGRYWGTEFVGRTGYTGEDGVEFIVSADLAKQLWSAFIEAGVQPCGLGARDTLRLESGMALHGNDLDETHTPLESGLEWTVSLKEERDFVGKQALIEPSEKNLVGLILTDRGVLRGHQSVVLDDQVIGEVTSGTYSPTLEQSIALARVDKKLEIGQTVQIAVRQKHLNAVVARFPFVKNGSATN
ncbi:aminomethyltransferase [Arenicella xantha]|uniref:Aminomethyltransferase n=2 Tax=Arenicella xantha TaxID=644221 RepID=A0A395JM12_9GAMM|nr:aminomethyltransferase [Arenicella xantha]